ncbi:uncharacterized protein PADG_02002 [Paracoccidioides brasiliensis Pb18]|uniref:Homeobox domain-containing protein n=1 Tax=Paracoccidioides brasiliensis (strain Pb18) TaxID=502780 RepID=C1G4Y6_PARBD|nr:uncharacterized protein PADG_02002 [Paracoccidioides brasiliensis Pb18]EEH45852.2 hypothetical protein PADG_02002 [Paracoccidioides brasiliensis Pb18]
MASSTTEPVPNSTATTLSNSNSTSMTPSNTTTMTSNPLSSANAPITSSVHQNRVFRRPPRKSTLTQQQKNQKRQRATQDQLATLEMEFNKNPTPTAAVRERIAEEINMTERSVQIWFQNRRAKIKMIAKKGIESGEDCDAIPESMRQYLALHFDPSKSDARNLFNRGYGTEMHQSASSGKTVIHHLECGSLRIGSWCRVAQTAMDLIIFYCPAKGIVTYYIHNDSAGYKIEYPFAFIKNIVLESGDTVPGPDGTGPRTRGLVIELNRPPNFYMDLQNNGGFYQCRDFTENQQATKSLVHYLGGAPKTLSIQLANLVSLESFQNRLVQYDFNGYAVSAPVSPHLLHRPASQPNQLVRPTSSMYHQENHNSNNHFGMNLHPGRAHGHKRQRSRSVPALMDFASMTPIPSFHIQHPSTQFQPDPNIFAPIPIPQSRIPHNHIANNDLLIDTSASYAVDFRAFPQPPMSATTVATTSTTTTATTTTDTSSEFANPQFFPTNAPQAQNQQSQQHQQSQSQPQHLGTPYGLPFLSQPSPTTGPMLDQQPGLLRPSTSPLSHPYVNVSQVEPMIANASPPLSTLHGTGMGADVDEEMFSLSLSAEHMGGFPDSVEGNVGSDGANVVRGDGDKESIMLSEIYAKHKLNAHMDLGMGGGMGLNMGRMGMGVGMNLPMHGHDAGQHSPPIDDDSFVLAFQGLQDHEQHDDHHDIEIDIDENENESGHVRGHSPVHEGDYHGLLPFENGNGNGTVDLGSLVAGVSAGEG